MSTVLLYRMIRAGEFPALKLRDRYVIPAKAIDQMESDALAIENPPQLPITHTKQDRWGD